jgi:hypothetical protein
LDKQTPEHWKKRTRKRSGREDTHVIKKGQLKVNTTEMHEGMEEQAKQTNKQTNKQTKREDMKFEMNETPDTFV